MKKTVVTIILSCNLLVLQAQDATVKSPKEASGKEISKDPTDTVTKNWKKGGLFNFNMNQAALSNWAAGGDKSSL